MLVLLVIMEPPSTEAMVVIELDLVMGGVSVDPPADIPPAVLLLPVVTVLLAADVVVELVLVTDSSNVDGAPDSVVASFVVTTDATSWPPFAVLSGNLFNSALSVVSSNTSQSSQASHLILSASTDRYRFSSESVVNLSISACHLLSVASATSPSLVISASCALLCSHNSSSSANAAEFHSCCSDSSAVIRSFSSLNSVSCLT